MHKTDIFLKESNNNNDNNIIFLDIDGVIQPYHNQMRFDHDMNSTIGYLSLKYEDDIYTKMDIYDVCAAYYDWDYVALGILRDILERYHSDIVLSSDWRSFHSLESIKALFKLYDMDSYIKDKCPGQFPDNQLSKEEAIIKYLNNHKVDNYLVIDDKDMTKTFGQNFRKTSNTLKVEDIIYASLIFNNDKLTFKRDNNYIDIMLNNDETPRVSFKYEYKNENDLKTLYLELYNFRYYNYDGQVILEYILNYLYKLENVNQIIVNMNKLNTNDLNISGYKANNNYVLTKHL